MRCEECGHNISGLADDAPCTECGVVTPVARREAPPLNMRRVVLGFAWPYMAIAGVFVLLWLGIAIELIAFVVLQGWPPLARTFQMAPIPSQLWWWLLLCIPAPLLAVQLRTTWKAHHHGSNSVMA
jgi:hypothetical protein